jgi:hypothetical protein
MTLLNRPSSSLRNRRRRFAPLLDALEVRALLSTIVVTNNGDSGPGSLRQAIADAPSGGTIVFAPALRGETIALSSGALEIAKNLSIQGPGSDRLSVSGSNTSGVFDVASGETVTISGLTITGGSASQGGGISNAGNLTLDHDAVTGNQAGPFIGEGGGIYNSGTLALDHSTVSGNQASAFSAEGGGMYNSGTATLDHSAVSDNQAASTLADGGGIMNSGGTLTLQNSTISGNTVMGTSGSLGGTSFGGGIADFPTETTPSNMLS